MKKWIENFWYHYKWPTIIISFFVTILIIGIVQIANKTTYDIHIMYVGNDEISGTQHTELLKVLSNKYVVDANEDKEINIDFSRTAFVVDTKYSTDGKVNSDSLEFLSTMLVQPYYIYIMRKDVYDNYINKECFVKLSSVFDNKDISELLYDESAIVLNKTNASKENSIFNVFDDDCVIALKQVPYSFSKNKTESERIAFNIHKDLFKKLVEN